MTDLRKQVDDLRAWIAAAEARREALQKENVRLKAVLLLLKSAGPCVVNRDAIIDEALKR